MNFIHDELQSLLRLVMFAQPLHIFYSVFFSLIINSDAKNHIYEIKTTLTSNMIDVNHDCTIICVKNITLTCFYNHKILTCKILY